MKMIQSVPDENVKNLKFSCGSKVVLWVSAVVCFIVFRHQMRSPCGVTDVSSRLILSIVSQFPLLQALLICLHAETSSATSPCNTCHPRYQNRVFHLRSCCLKKSATLHTRWFRSSVPSQEQNLTYTQQYIQSFVKMYQTESLLSGYLLYSTCSLQWIGVTDISSSWYK